MLGEFAHFLGLPDRARYNTGELMNTIATLIGTCGTELIVVDEIHNLNQRYRQMAEASDTLKQLSEKCPRDLRLRRRQRGGQRLAGRDPWQADQQPLPDHEPAEVPSHR
ncbi:TniB family NTP-binding protein [Microbacterium oxydans]|nr:TniB family NTP-binding protein [Microbacterium oxydans]